MEKEETTDKPEEEKEEVKWFECSICNLKEVYASRSTSSNSKQYISFSDGCYIAKDPFTPPEKKQFLILGSDCCMCKNPVCQSNDCSIFYKRRYCQNCAWDKRDLFPEQLHSKIKQI